MVAREPCLSPVFKGIYLIIKQKDLYIGFDMNFYYRVSYYTLYYALPAPEKGRATGAIHAPRTILNPKRGAIMAEDEKRFARELMGKTVVSKTGKKFGEVGDMVFEVKSGELIHMVLVNPTPYSEKLELEKDKENNVLIPFSALMAIGDFMVIAEEDIV